jgi:hypothetical protein
MTTRALVAVLPILSILSILLVTPAGTGEAFAQLISIRTVPVSQADQFDIFPSQTLGMGGVSIALPDTLLDPFSNPAKGMRLGVARFFGSPAFYGVSNEAGAGRALPVGAFARTGLWYGGVSLALQEVDASRRNVVPVFQPGILDAAIRPAPPPQSTVDLGPGPRTHGNAFAFAMLGKVLPEARLSLAGSVFWANLHAVDGVDLLYAGSQRIKQFGHAVDVRLGLLKELAGDRSLEAVVVHNRYDMTHDVTYVDFFWDPGTQQTRQRPRIDQNLDRTNTWGLHVEYERPLSASGWRIGWLATANRMSHPKIPNYEIMSIPRDPGHSSAFNFGIGLSSARGPATFGIDAIYEPIWSHTWADAAVPIETRTGDMIPAGGKTIENRFRFSNALFRMGVSRDLGKTTALQLGLMVRSIHYWLAQYDNVQLAGRNQEESWREWTPTWGLTLRFPELEIRYRGHVTSGTGRPGVAPTGGLELADARTNIIAAPSGPLTLDEVRVTTHQVSISLPIR